MNQKKLRKFWLGKKVFITGHTGFKGTWLCIMLEELGAIVTGFSLPLTNKNILFKKTKIIYKLKKSYSGDIRNYKFLKKCILLSNPEIIIHMAAQAFVGESYLNPKHTYEVNTLGTVNILNIVKELNSIKTTLIITSDKVYKNTESKKPYDENDEVGGFDPYSSSKACAEIIINSYIKSFFRKKNINVVSARAGNVIGGGDYSKTRIIPDYMDCLKRRLKLNLRHPQAIRPWQHVIEPLTGYLFLLAKIEKNKKLDKNYSWNFGPGNINNQPVIKVINLLNKYSDYFVKVSSTKNPNNYHETNVLKLNSNKAKKLLGWKSHLNLNRSIFLVVEWYRMLKKSKNAYYVCKKQIMDYFKIL